MNLTAPAAVAAPETAFLDMLRKGAGGFESDARSIAAAARSVFGAWRSPAEFVLFARSVPKADRARARQVPRVSTSRRW